MDMNRILMIIGGVIVVGAIIISMVLMGRGNEKFTKDMSSIQQLKENLNTAVTIEAAACGKQACIQRVLVDLTTNLLHTTDPSDEKGLIEKIHLTYISNSFRSRSVESAIKALLNRL